MEDFLVSIDYDGSYYVASFFSGKTVELSASNYQDAVLEADTLDIGEFNV